MADAGERVVNATRLTPRAGLRQEQKEKPDRTEHERPARTSNEPLGFALPVEIASALKFTCVLANAVPSLFTVERHAGTPKLVGIHDHDGEADERESEAERTDERRESEGRRQRSRSPSGVIHLAASITSGLACAVSRSRLTPA
jgi:hypothetical protein